jgi:hypothetical protein
MEIIRAIVCMHILGATVATITNNNFGTGTGGNPDGTKLIQVSGGGISGGFAPGYIYGIWNQSTSTAMATYTGNNFSICFSLAVVQHAQAVTCNVLPTKRQGRLLLPAM